MLNVYVKYAKYYAYKRLSDTFKEAVNNLDTTRPSTSTYASLLFSCYDKLLDEFSAESLNENDSIEELVNKIERNSFKREVVGYLSGAKVKLFVEITRRERPTVHTICKLFDVAVDEVLKELVAVEREVTTC